MAGPALADSITLSAASGSLAASAKFETVGTNLEITLTNTSSFDVPAPASVLTALFFSVTSGPLSLTPVSAVLDGGSVVFFDDAPVGGVVGGEWEYEDSFGGPAPGGASYGISSSGFGLFGSGEIFPGPNLDPPPNVDGLNYGVTSAGDNPATGNAAVTGGFPLIKNSVKFTLSGLPVDFSLTRISGVNWQYGTDLSEPNIPEPSTLALLLVSGAAIIRRHR